MIFPPSFANSDTLSTTDAKASPWDSTHAHLVAYVSSMAFDQIVGL